MNILLAEDDMLIAMDMQMIMEDAGHKVFGPVATVAQGEAALAEHVPDVAIVDIGLKNGDSGIDLARRLRERCVPVVFVSGEPTRAQAGRDVAVAFLPKPVMPDDLTRSIDVAAAIASGGAMPERPDLLQVFQTEPLAVRAS